MLSWSNIAGGMPNNLESATAAASAAACCAIDATGGWCITTADNAMGGSSEMSSPAYTANATRFW